MSGVRCSESGATADVANTAAHTPSEEEKEGGEEARSRGGDTVLIGWIGGWDAGRGTRDVGRGTWNVGGVTGGHRRVQCQLMTEAGGG